MYWNKILSKKYKNNYIELFENLESREVVACVYSDRLELALLKTQAKKTNKGYLVVFKTFSSNNSIKYIYNNCCKEINKNYL